MQQVLIILMGRVNRNHKTTLMNEAIFNWWLQNMLLTTFLRICLKVSTLDLGIGSEETYILDSGCESLWFLHIFITIIKLQIVCAINYEL